MIFGFLFLGTLHFTVETFRQDDEKGLAPRAFYQSLGFEEGELCCFEEEYPVQKFILKGSNSLEEKEMR